MKLLNISLKKSKYRNSHFQKQAAWNLKKEIKKHLRLVKLNGKKQQKKETILTYLLNRLGEGENIKAKPNKKKNKVSKIMKKMKTKTFINLL